MSSHHRLLLLSLLWAGMLAACKNTPAPVEPETELEKLEGSYEGLAVYFHKWYADSAYHDTVSNQPVYIKVLRVANDTFPASITLQAMGSDSIRLSMSSNLSEQLVNTYTLRFAWEGTDSTYRESFACYDCSSGASVSFSAEGDTLYFKEVFSVYPANSHREIGFAGMK